MEVGLLVLAFEIETVIDQTDTALHVIDMSGTVTGCLNAIFVYFCALCVATC